MIQTSVSFRDIDPYPEKEAIWTRVHTRIYMIAFKPTVSFYRDVDGVYPSLMLSIFGFTVPAQEDATGCFLCL